MKIDMYVSGAVASGKNKQSGTAIVCTTKWPDGRTQRREMTFGFDAATINVAAIRSITIACKAIRQWALLRAPQITIHTDSHYAIEALARVDGKFKIEPRTNLKEVAEARAVVGALVGLSLAYEKFDSGIGNQCAVLARAVALSQQATDTGTREVADVSAGLQEKVAN